MGCVCHVFYVGEEGEGLVYLLLGGGIYSVDLSRVL